MKFSTKLAAIGASAALAVTVLATGTATAVDVNYAPGLPAPQAGVPNNPPAASPVVQGVVLVDASVAASTPPSVMEKPPTPKIGGAPKPKVKRGQPVALVTKGLTPGATYVVQIKKKGGEYGTLGSVVGGADGSPPRLPARHQGHLHHRDDERADRRDDLHQGQGLVPHPLIVREPRPLRTGLSHVAHTQRCLP